MKKIIAIPSENKVLCAHFGHCQEFAIIEVEDGKIVSESWIDPPEHVPGLYPKFLAEKGVSVVIAGGMGVSAQTLFKNNNIDVYYGVKADAPKTVVEIYLAGDLQAGENLCDH